MNLRVSKQILRTPQVAVPTDKCSMKQSQRDLTNFAQILASGYLRLLAKHGANWRERLELRENQKDGKSAKTGSNRLDYSAERSIRCTGGKMITATLTRS